MFIVSVVTIITSLPQGLFVLAHKKVNSACRIFYDMQHQGYNHDSDHKTRLMSVCICQLAQIKGPVHLV